MRTAKFWTDTAERAGKTFAQALLASMTVGVAITDIDWASALSIAGTATLASVLISMASSGFGNRSTPSLLGGDAAGDAAGRLED
ncbi:holin [Nocardia vulneris]|uniref:holin n=1 Tax=Nocardia vulneris TaxID=1141657 RepID=UPI000689F4AE|nr:holin [Nocardia vulneris]